MKDALDAARAISRRRSEELARETRRRRTAERARRAAADRIVKLESTITAFCAAAGASLNEACDDVPGVIAKVRANRVDLRELEAAIGWVANTNEDRPQKGTDAEDRLRHASVLRVEREALKRDLEGARLEWRHHIDTIARALGEIPDSKEDVGVAARAVAYAAAELLDRSRTLAHELERERGIVDALVRKGEARESCDAESPR